MKALKEFLWYKVGEKLLDSDSEHFDQWKKEGLISGDLPSEPVVEKKPLLAEEPKIDLDVNNDGKVDDKDISIMAKTVGRRGGRPKRSVRRSKK